MTVRLYKYSGEKNRLDKTALLGTYFDTDATIKGTFNVEAPQLVLNYTGGRTISEYNYASMVVDGVTYYYYVTISGEIGNRMLCTCARDPLMSFKTDLLNCSIIARRTSMQGKVFGGLGYNSFLQDPLHPILQTTSSMDLRGQDGGEASLGVLLNGAYSWNTKPILVTVG